MLAHSKQRQRRNITNITASTANNLGSNVLSGNNNNNKIIRNLILTKSFVNIIIFITILYHASRKFCENI
jgi:hypothetical protein